uniref:NADH-ubiquinone oxidoreductase chain 4 n=1 Tax=Hypsauchenia hardwickii TaxID=2605027 RepID=A0A5B9TCC6_9HEMI|nr:NADH dehydrogenase subunit 4 [Hypsauchenia hardwickii]QEG98429.1 NADH dehydrogenase subunit 4 [Hypsauchenia hardwickii]
MMSYFLYMFFMTPILFMNFWYSYQFLYMIFILFFIFNYSNMGMTSISYFFGIDYISYNLIILSFYIIMLMNLASINIFNKNFFCFVNYLIVFLLYLIFSSLNMLIMYMSFEFILIPLMILIVGWGYQPERLSSSIYLFFYTLFGSLPLFVFIIFFYNNLGTLNFFFSLKFNFNFFMHLLMILPFLVKLPMFMLHFWLPKAHVQAPVSGSMILAGLMLKIGGYGIIRFIYLNEYFFYTYSYIWVSFGLLGCVMVSLICLVQVDMKCLIAYSSISHMSLCLLGVGTLNKFGLLGSLIMMISHGLCSSGLFCLANICYLRVNTRSLYLIKGMISFMPSLSLFWFLFLSFNMGCPPSINFVSELLIFMSSLSYFDYSYIYFSLSSFICACFSFYLYSYSQHGSFSYLYSYSDIKVSEFLLCICHLFPLILLLFMFIIL